MIPGNAQAEEYGSHCYPSEEQIQMYKEDGSWEKRQEYAKKLNNFEPSQELLKNALQRGQRKARTSAGENIPNDWKGMQVTGDAKMLVVRVEFADVTFENSKNYSEEELLHMMIGNEETGFYPYESLNAYYKRSSYNKLNITTDQVYTCTLSKNRDEYEWEDTGEQELIKEVMEQLDATVDFSEYDMDQNGKIDGICINFAGENTGWGSTWWSHKYDFLDSNFKCDDVTPAGYVFLETYEVNDSYGTQTLIHETGHLLGLPDYYSQYGNGIGTSDMMNNNRGEHNGFSKWLLGWIEEENILKINKASDITKVELAPLSSEDPGNNKMIAVIAPEDTSIYSEYFVVQYDEYIGNQSIFELENPAYRIFHVDAHLNEEGNNFQYNNVYAYDKLLIKSVSVMEGEYDSERYFYMDGDELTPDTKESSAFYGGEILGYTGIELTEFKTGETPSFQVSFREKEAVDGKLELQIAGGTVLNMAEVTLLSNKPLINVGSYQEEYLQAYLEDGDGKCYPLELNVEDGTKQIKISYIDIANSLKAEKEYTLVIPAGMFQIDKDVYSEECRLTIKTGLFPEIVTSYEYGPNPGSDIFHVDDTKSGCIQIIDYTDENWNAQLHLFEDTKGSTTELQIPIPQPYNEVMEIEGMACYDDTIAVCISSISLEDYSSIHSFYKIDKEGNVLAGPFSMMEELNVFPAGNGLKGTCQDSGAVGSPELDDEFKSEIYTIDFETEPTSRLIDTQKYMSNVYALDEESYIVMEDSEQGYKAYIYNNEDELIKSIDLSAYINTPVCAVSRTEDRLAIVCSTYLENDEYAMTVNEFDMEGSYIGTREIIRFQEWKNIDNWKLEKTSWGYSLSNMTSEQSHFVCFLNDEFELISSMQVPEILSSVSHMGNRCAVRWYDLMTYGYRIAITEPIVEENETMRPEPNQPSEENGTKQPSKDKDKGKVENSKPNDSSESKDAADENTPRTGDDNHLMLIYAAFLISGGIILRGFKKKINL